MSLNIVFYDRMAFILSNAIATLSILPLSYIVNLPFRDCSLITGKGGYKTGRGACEVLPLQKGGWGGGKGLSHAEGGGHKMFWGSFYTVA